VRARRADSSPPLRRATAAITADDPEMPPKKKYQTISHLQWEP
jgi:hypothetical protein